MAVKILAVSCPETETEADFSNYRFSLWLPSPWPSQAMATELPTIHTEATATATGVHRAFMVITTTATMARERLSLATGRPQCM